LSRNKGRRKFSRAKFSGTTFSRFCPFSAFRMLFSREAYGMPYCLDEGDRDVVFLGEAELDGGLGELAFRLEGGLLRLIALLFVENAARDENFGYVDISKYSRLAYLVKPADRVF